MENLKSKKINDEIIIDIEMVKITGKIRGINKQIDLVMDKETFFEWKDNINR